MWLLCTAERPVEDNNHDSKRYLIGDMLINCFMIPAVPYELRSDQDTPCLLDKRHGRTVFEVVVIVVFRESNIKKLLKTTLH